VFITAHDDPAVRAQAEASGCAGYFRKTNSGTDILAAIRRAIGPEAPEGNNRREGGDQRTASNASIHANAIP
jgi:DNA-binding NarL/FixJ family response regulator